jgi:hypothetical protein
MGGCFDGPHPLLAIRYLLEISAFHVIFQLDQASAATIGPSYGNSCCELLELAVPILAAYEVRYKLRSLLACSLYPADSQKLL